MILAALLLAVSPVPATEVNESVREQSLDTGSVLAAVERLPPGGFLWMPQAAPQGPMIMIVNVRTQRAVLYRNGIPIGVTTISTGGEGHETPLGVFTILEKRIRHFSNLYDDAPMPYMQRLTWGGVALHGGHLPGYPASHGCIRLPEAFAKLLYAETRLGMTVVVADQPLAPAVAPGADPFREPDEDAPFTWTPEISPDGPVSILISGSDLRVSVLRNGVPIGWGTVRIDGTIDHPFLYSLVGMSAEGKRIWAQIALPGQKEDARSKPPRIHVAGEFELLVSTILAPGTTVILTPDTLIRPVSENPHLLESEPPARP
jgi:hypothetical protein